MIDSACASEPNEPKYKVGDRIQITLNNKIVEATITAIVKHTDGLRLQVSYGHDLTTLRDCRDRGEP